MPLRCSREDLIAVPENSEIRDLDLFTTRSTDRNPFADPPFLVPAIIDALRANPHWNPRTWVVPGEADVYCAEHVSRHGGLVLTSDSDLLVYNLNQGEVIFFKDLHRKPSSLEIYGLSYSPACICRRLGLPSPTSLCRVAYELTQNRHATIGMLKGACSQVVFNESTYAAFCQSYSINSDLSTFVLEDELAKRIRKLDPRLSELVVQLNDLSKTSEVQAYPLCVTLPVLIEDPSLPNAWSGSASVRQIAYSVLHRKFPTNNRVGIEVREYARVQSLPPHGRTVELLSSSQTEKSVHQFLGLARQIQGVADNHESLFWSLFCIALDERECHAHVRESHAWQILKKRPKPSLVNADDIPWSFTHFAAQLQAMCYSLRLLYQVLIMDADDSPTGKSSIMEKMKEFLQDLPTLQNFPTLSVVLQLQHAVREAGLLSSMNDLLGAAPNPKSSNCDNTRIRKRVKVSAEKPLKPKVSGGAQMMRNRFSVLSEDCLSD